MVNLAALTYNPRTSNLKLGLCSTVHFMVLLLGQAGTGGLTHSQVHKALAAFRNKPINKGGQVGCCNHLTNRIYGYVSFAFNPTVPWPVFFYRFGTNTRSLWYRPSHGVYALNANGQALYAQLLATL